jgi:hypothetical protein
MRIYGTGFLAQFVLYWDGLPAAKPFNSCNSLRLKPIFVKNIMTLMGNCQIRQWVPYSAAI